MGPDVARAVAAWGRAGLDAAWVRVVHVWGFGGAEVGESVVVARDGTQLGRLLAGCLDEDVRRLTTTLLDGPHDAVTFGYSVGDGPAVAAGLACGGRVELLAQRLQSVPVALWQAIDGGRPATVVTVCSGAAAGATATIDGSGRHGEQRLVDLGVGEVVLHHSGLVGANARRRTIDAGGERILLEVVLPVVRLVVVGRGELSEALCAQAGLLGWEAFTVDGLDEAEGAVERLGSNDALVVLTHMSEVDTPVLARALRQGVGFVGALGSRRTQAARAARLRAEGLSDEWIANIHGPVGLDLGAASPAETAVAVVAEVLLVRSVRSGVPLRDTTGRING